ncbi:MAG: energy transducer TonB [Terriglobales bacterium]|jgi:TonB family protein
MIRRLFVVFALLFVSTIALEQETGSPDTRVAPCALHPVNGRLCVSEGVLLGFLLRRVAPKLPIGANPDGEVILHVAVAKNGKPLKIAVISGDPMLAHSAVQAVRRWLFMPYTYRGKDVEMESDVHVRFATSN